MATPKTQIVLDMGYTLVNIQYYNTERFQRNLGVLTPMEKHERYFAA